MKIERAEMWEVSTVAHDMRESDFREFSALCNLDDRAKLALRLERAYGKRDDVMCAYSGDDPVCIGGALTTRPGVASLLFFATDRFPEIAVSMTRWIKRELFPRLRAAGVRRIDAVTAADHGAAQRWLNLLGLEHEATHPCFGKNGETYLTFAWTDAGAPGDQS